MDIFKFENSLRKFLFVRELNGPEPAPSGSPKFCRPADGRIDRATEFGRSARWCLFVQLFNKLWLLLVSKQNQMFWQTLLNFSGHKVSTNIYNLFKDGIAVPWYKVVEIFVNLINMQEYSPGIRLALLVF